MNIQTYLVKNLCATIRTVEILLMNVVFLFAFFHTTPLDCNLKILFLPDYIKQVVYNDYNAELRLRFDTRPIEWENQQVFLHITKYIAPQDVPLVTVYQVIYEFPSLPMKNVLRSKGEWDYSRLAYLSAAYRESVRIYHYKNIYFNNHDLYTQDSLICLYSSYKTFINEYIRVSDRVYDSVIIARQHYKAFGNYVSDSPLFLLINMPQEITRKSVFINWGRLDEVTAQIFDDHGLEWVDFNGVCLDLNYAKNLYFAESPDFAFGNLRVLLKLRDIAYNKYNVSIIKPHIGLVTNNPAGKPRHVHNMDEFIEAAKKNYPDLEWRFEDDKKLSFINQSIKTLAATKIYVTVPGSLAFKAMYMQKGTGVFIFGTNIDEWSNYIITYVLNIWCTCTRNKYLHHDKNLTGPIDVDYNIKYLKYLMYAVDHQGWCNDALSDTETVLLFDMEPVKQILEYNPNIALLPSCNLTNYYKYITTDPFHYTRCGNNELFKIVNDLPGKTKEYVEDPDFNNWTPQNKEK